MWRRANDNAWALHREHIRAGRIIVLVGPDPRMIYSPATWPEIEQALRLELDFVERHLGVYPDYCILNLCRLIYSFEARDIVVLKEAAATWANATLPEWQQAIGLAKKSYARQATEEDRVFMLGAAQRLYAFAVARIDAH